MHSDKAAIYKYLSILSLNITCHPRQTAESE